MKKQSKRRVLTLELVDLLDECACRKFLIDLVRGPVCRYCGESIPEKHLGRFYRGEEVYCRFCNSKFYAVAGTMIADTKLTYKRVLKVLIMLNLGYRTKEIAETVNIGTHAVPRWRKKLYEFENE